MRLYITDPVTGPGAADGAPLTADGGSPAAGADGHGGGWATAGHGAGHVAGGSGKRKSCYEEGPDGAFDGYEEGGGRR